MRRIVVEWVAASLLLVAILSAAVSATAQNERYHRSSIADARFGTADRERLLKLAYGLSQDLGKTVYGQDAAIAVLEAKLIQHFEGFPNRTGEPIMMNMIGFAGVGKSAIIEFLKRKGFPVLEYDAQDYAEAKKDFNADLFKALEEKGYGSGGTKKPVIVVVEELDKVAEKRTTGKDSTEVTSGLIGAINKISSDGKVAASESSGRTVSVSNAMFITTMNISPTDIEQFSAQVLKKKKSYYDFTVDDFVKFDQWIRIDPASRYKILSNVFRTNTVGRLGANTSILRPLVASSYREIIREQIARAIRQNVQGKNLQKQVSVDVHASMIDFLEKRAIYAPSGARETVHMTNALIEQLVNFGIKITGEGLESIDRPRKIEIRYSSESDSVDVRVTERILLRGKSGLQDGAVVSFKAEYDPASRIFLRPAGLSSLKPEYAETEKAPSSKRVSKKDVLALRFPEENKEIGTLAKVLEKDIYGQSEVISILVDDFKKYLGRGGPAKKEPSSRFLAGFTGVGKSELFKLIGKALGLPIVKMNMQEYSTDSPDAVYKLLSDLEEEISEAQGVREDGRYMLLIEELDKATEIDEQRKLVTRPVMGIIKDLLNDGQLKLGDGGHMDLRRAFIGGTMNFGTDSFGFEADPRLTSIEDVHSEWKRMKSTLAEVKNRLSKIFLPDTISRLMPQLVIVRPLDKNAYAKIVDQQLREVQAMRLNDADDRNVGQIKLRPTTAYRQYIFRETVVPSEGARNTSKTSHMLMAADLEHAISHLPRSSPYAALPLLIVLDYSAARQAVRYKLTVDMKAISKKQLALAETLQPFALPDRKVALNFPPPAARGRLTDWRVLVSAHEFGHAFTGVRFGHRFEHVVVVAPSPETGGYVKTNDKGFTAADRLASLYMTLGSRAFERIIYSPDPLNRESVLRITTGSSSDIQQATESLYETLYSLGMNPDGGTLDRNFKDDGNKYASYQEMPSELAENLGMILRDIEDEIVRETLEEHPLDWYVEKISVLAKTGAMTETQFYQLIGRQMPEANRRSVGSTNAHFRSLFAKLLVKPTSAEKRAAQDRAGGSGLSAAEQTERALASFTRIVRHRLGVAAEAAPRGEPAARSCRAIFHTRAL